MLQSLARDRKPILVIGRAGMDLYPDPPGTRTEDALCFTTALGGSSANIAAALTRYQIPVSLLTCVSDDAVGRFVTNQLHHYGVNADLVRTIQGDERTSLALAESRVDDHQSVIYRNNAADFQMDKAQMDAVNFSDYRALIITGTCLTLEPSRGASLLALERAKKAGIPVVMDLDYRPYSWESAQTAQQVYHSAVEYVDLLVGNDEEFGHLAGDYDAGFEEAQKLAASGCNCIYKQGPLGSQTLVSDGQIIRTGVFSATPLKPTGAGDAFLGGVIASLCRGEPVSEAIVMGSAAAALVVTRVGCAPAMPRLDEIEEFRSTSNTTQEVTGV
jgi:5-dehydro-2-deoxygluconokinase